MNGNQIRIPGDLNPSIRLFGNFTVPNLARLAVPTAAGLAIAQPLTLSLPDMGMIATGLAAGSAWMTGRPYGYTSDHLARQAPRWKLEKETLEGLSVDLLGDRAAAVTDPTSQVNPSAVVGLIEVDSPSLEMMSKSEAAALHDIYREICDTVTYPVQIHSIQHELTLEDYTERIQSSAHHTGKTVEDYIRYVEDASRSEITTTRHYLSIPVHRNNLDAVGTLLSNHLSEDHRQTLEQHLPVSIEPESEDVEDLLEELDGRCRDVIDTVDSGELTASRVTGKQLQQLITQSNDRSGDVSPRWTSNPSQDEDGRFRRSLYLSSYPSSLPVGWTRELLKLDGSIGIHQSINPVDPGKASKQLQSVEQKTEVEIETQVSKGYGGVSDLERTRKDVDWMQQLLTDQEDSVVEYGVCITVEADTQRKCEQVFGQVRNRLNTLQIDFQEPIFRTDQTWISSDLFFQNGLNESQLMPGRSATAGYPFGTRRINQDTGIVYGLDNSDDTPVLLDRFQWASHSMVRMGTVGSGKSYAAKLELIRALLAYPDLQVAIVDPKQEYKSLATHFGGNYHTLEPNTEYSFENEVVGFEPEKRGDGQNKELLVDVVRQVYDSTSQNQDPTLVLIDEARQLLNREDGREALNEFLLEARDTNTAVSMITQNASHFTHSREGREILDNTPGKLFMRHDRVPQSVVDYFQLSEREKQELYKLKTGTDSPYSEAILKVSGRLDTQIKIESTDSEHRLIREGEQH
jgi:type IV secretory pathway VirB4 component